MPPNIKRPPPFLRTAGAPALLLGLWLATACGCAGERAAPPPPRTFTDDLQRAVVLPRAAGRVVTLAPSLTEIVYVAGAGGRLVGVGEPDDYPPDIARLPRVAVFPPDFEAITALKPDLVLATDQINTPRDAETLAALGIPVYFFTFTRLSDVPRAVRTVGELLGTGERATAAADSLERRMAALRAATDTLSDPPTVLFLIGDDVLYSFGRESYMHELITLAGGRSVMADVASVSPVLSDEFVLTRRPDVIVLPSPGPYDPARLLRLHPTWDVVPALRTGRVYGVDPDLFLRPSPRLIEAAYQLAALLRRTPTAP